MKKKLFRKIQKIELLAFDEEQGFLVCNEGKYDDQWWVPATVFESLYESVE